MIFEMDVEGRVLQAKKCTPKSANGVPVFISGFSVSPGYALTLCSFGLRLYNQ